MGVLRARTWISARESSCNCLATGSLIGRELLRRGVACEADPDDTSVFDGVFILTGAVGGLKRLHYLKIPRPEDKAILRAEDEVIMSSFALGRRRMVAPTLGKTPGREAIRAWLISQVRLRPAEVQAAGNRWSFDLRHRLRCFGTLEEPWRTIPWWRQRDGLSDDRRREFCMRIMVTPLIFTDKVAQLLDAVYPTDASREGAGSCRTAELTDRGRQDRERRRGTGVNGLAWRDLRQTALGDRKLAGGS